MRFIIAVKATSVITTPAIQAALNRVKMGYAKNPTRVLAKTVSRKTRNTITSVIRSANVVVSTHCVLNLMSVNVLVVSLNTATIPVFANLFVRWVFEILTVYGQRDRVLQRVTVDVPLTVSASHRTSALVKRVTKTQRLSGTLALRFALKSASIVTVLHLRTVNVFLVSKRTKMSQINVYRSVVWSA